MFIKGSHPTPFVYEITTGVTVMIGREDDCDVHIDSPEISRRHCSVFYEDGQLYIEDAGSKLGTKVNGSKVEKIILKAGDKISLSPYSSFKISNKGLSEAKVVSTSESKPPVFETSAVTARVGMAQPAEGNESEIQQTGINKKKITVYIAILVVLLSLILLAQVFKNKPVEEKILSNDQYLSILDNVLNKFQEDKLIDYVLLKQATLSKTKYDTAAQLEKSLELFKKDPANDKNFSWDNVQLQLNKLKDCILLSSKQEKWVNNQLDLSKKESEHQKVSNIIVEFINKNDSYNALIQFKTLPKECIYKKHHEDELMQLKQEYTALKLKKSNELIYNKKYLEASDVFNQLSLIHVDNKKKGFKKKAKHYRDLDNDLKQYSIIMKYIHSEKIEMAQALFEKINPDSTYKPAISREMKMLSKAINSKNAKEQYHLGNVEAALAKLDSNSQADRILENHIKRVSTLYRMANSAFDDKNLKLAIEKWKEVCLLEPNHNNQIVINSKMKLKKWPDARAKAQVYLDWGDEAIENENIDEARKMYSEANKIKPKSANLHIENMSFLGEKYFLSGLKLKSDPSKALIQYKKAITLITPKDKIYKAVQNEINMLELLLKENL